jgi:hypothetical protein
MRTGQRGQPRRSIDFSLCLGIALESDCPTQTKSMLRPGLANTTPLTGDKTFLAYHYAAVASSKSSVMIRIK